MSKHTPGPWKVAKPRKSYRDGNMMYGIVGPECVSDYEDWGFTEANARLIAAAPELLEALRNLVEAATHHQADARAALAKARAAIAKAEAAHG